ncbi:MAG: DUF86 domain-containing protein [Candidatus Methanoperedens sp.]
MKSDEVFIKHILDEIGFLKAQSENLESEDLMKNEVLKRAFPRSIEIIGEAAKNISDPLKEKYPDIEWKKIVGMRDKLIHAYFGISWDIVWDVVKNKLPEMEKSIKSLNDKEFGKE